jgi:maltose alpha-D-glucosyltransferase / alpha-amylase
VLFTGTDFIIIDFEGEPARSLAERRTKQSPLKDVAGMIRSFQYAAYFSLLNEITPSEANKLAPWADLWYFCMGSVFLHSYLEVADGSPFIPMSSSELEMMLKAFLLEKAVYELGYELNNRPEWVLVPVRGIKYVLEEDREGH